jgi:putative flippase GtrA
MLLPWCLPRAAVLGRGVQPIPLQVYALALDGLFGLGPEVAKLGAVMGVLTGKTQNTLHQLIRYLFVGGGAAAVDTGTLYMLNAWLGVHHLIAAAVGFLLGLAVNYWISIAWVFESRGKLKEEFILFSIIGVGGLGWTELIMWVSVDLAGLHVMMGKAIALVLVLLWNFGMRKKFVFAVSQAARFNHANGETERPAM